MFKRLLYGEGAGSGEEQLQRESKIGRLDSGAEDREREELYFELVLLITGGTAAAVGAQYKETFTALGDIAVPLADFIRQSGGVAGAVTTDTFNIVYNLSDYLLDIIFCLPDMTYVYPK